MQVSLLFYENAAECAALCLPVGRGTDECSDFKNPIGRTFLSGTCIFAETGKSRLSVKPRPVDGEFHVTGWGLKKVVDL